MTAVIPVKQEFTTKGTEEKPGDTFRYLLTSTDETSQCHREAEGNSYEFSLKGNESTKISIPSSHGGVYRYELKQKIKKKRPDTPMMRRYMRSSCGWAARVKERTRRL